MNRRNLIAALLLIALGAAGARCTEIWTGKTVNGRNVLTPTDGQWVRIDNPGIGWCNAHVDRRGVWVFHFFGYDDVGGQMTADIRTRYLGNFCHEVELVPWDEEEW
jgi:hypothetical protein